MRSRRRKGKFTWFPVLGSVFQDGGDTRRVSAFFNELVVNNSDAGSPTIGTGMFIQPIVPDFTPQEDGGTTNFTLSDFVQGQDWILKRLVGKCFVSLDWSRSEDITGGWPAVLVTAGFFVARASENNGGDVGLDDTSIDPQGALNTQNPWIWRRSWLLGTDLNPSGEFNRNPGYPQNNLAGYGSGILDGPHLDSKVARRIMREQRLWFVCSAQGISPSGISVGGEGTADISVNVVLDVRVLGAMRRGRNVSAF